jgi:ABC-type lipoprotein export system ATPase subunit
MEVLKKLNRQGKTIIVITHNKSVAAYAHKIISIKDGKIIKQKTITKHK